MVRYRTAAFATATAIVGLVLGLWLGGHPSGLPTPVRDLFVQNDGAVRAELIKDVQDNYYKTVSQTQLQDASLAGIISSLHDPFSQYFTPSQTKQFNQAFSGEFDGVGMQAVGDAQGLRVDQVFSGSPAQRSGIHAGDQIIAVNGRSIAGEPAEVATAKIQGPAGTAVTLAIRPAANGSARTVKLTRAHIQLPVTEGKMVTSGGAKIGVVSLMTFSDNAHVAVRKQVDKLLAAGARGIVLDLRGNGGGLLQEGIAVASIFVDKGLVVSTKGRRRPEQKYYATGGAINPKIPVAVLVNGGTASASEIVTGALRDHGRATVVGTKTFGKGVFQEIEPLSNDGELKITVGSYYLPDGENLAGHGIVPQVPAADSPAAGLATAVSTLRKQIP